jgi:hypothetical protein
MSGYTETGWTLPDRENLYVTLPAELASELERIAANVRSSSGTVIADALAYVVESGWTTSRETVQLQPGGLPKEISLDPALRELLEQRRATLAASGKNVDLSSLVVAILSFYLEKKLGATVEKPQGSGTIVS